MNRWIRYAVAFAIVLSWSATAEAWLRMHYEDAAVMVRSEAIVVGRLDKDSIKYVPHENPVGGTSWEYHATLLVSETLKGPPQDKHLDIVINYGLDPLVGGVPVRPNGDPNPPPAPAGFPRDRIDIVDTGGKSEDGWAVLENAQKDNLWFLRHLGGELGREPGKGPWGIVDPEDVQPLKFKDYFKALLSADAEKKIDGLLAGPDEAVCLRMLRYLSARHRADDTRRITALLTAPKAKLQTAAAEALAEVGDLSAVATFREALQSPNAGVRLAACNFLCRFRDRPSLGTISKLLPQFDSLQQASLIANLPRMESRAVVDLLLDRLDEHLDSNPTPMWAYNASVEAAKALKTLTGIEFPLGTAQARQRWNNLKALPDEVLLRKRILEDIEALTSPQDYDARSGAYEALGRLANQHFGSYNAFHSGHDAAGREESQRQWRLWATDNITRPRIDWIYQGFARSGIVLPRPMDASGIETLIAVLAFYANPAEAGRTRLQPEWSVDGGWVKANFHRYNANWLLEQCTGHKVGLSPYYQDLRVTSPDGDVASGRWAAWWQENRDRVKIQSLPEETAVTAETLSKTPSLRLPPQPLVLTIRPAKEVHVFRGKEPLTIVVEVKNRSAKDVLIERRPMDVRYQTRTGSGTRGGDGRGGQSTEDFVVLKPGESITWRQADAPACGQSRRAAVGRRPAVRVDLLCRGQPVRPPRLAGQVGIE